MIPSNVFALLCLACVSVPSLAQSPAAIYRPTILESQDPNYYLPNLLNNRGDYTVVGRSDGGSDFPERLQYATGEQRNMSAFSALNDRGQAVGSGRVAIPGSDPQGYRYSGLYLDGPGVHELPGYTPTAINNAGTIAAVGSNDSILFDIATGQSTTLPMLNANPTFAYSINDSGRVVGVAQSANGNAQAFVFENGEISALPFAGSSISKLKINASGQIFSSYTDAAGAERHVLYENGVVTDISDILRGGSVVDFNDRGQILFNQVGGHMMYIDGVAHEIRLEGEGPEGTDFRLVSALNDEGQLLAMTCPTPFQGYCDVVRLDFVSTIPEPPVWAMMAVGLLLTVRPWRLRRVGDCPQKGTVP